ERGAPEGAVGRGPFRDAVAHHGAPRDGEGGGQREEHGQQIAVHSVNLSEPQFSRRVRPLPDTFDVNAAAEGPAGTMKQNFVHPRRKAAARWLWSFRNMEAPLWRARNASARSRSGSSPPRRPATTSS